MMRLELGVGVRPTPGYVHHDRIKHGDHIDLAFDLARIPWPVDAESVTDLLATDVFEHLALPIDVWLDEAWRVLAPAGVLSMRLPAFDHDLSYRDPTHHRVFHPETFDYWDPDRALWRDFGRYYFDTGRWWRVESVAREVGDLRYVMRKRSAT